MPIKFPADHSKWSKLIWDVAAGLKLDPALISALVQVESLRDPWAVRYEGNYRWLVDFKHPLVTSATERNAQKSSWGLMQIMGAVARERGFKGPFLSQLCDPREGLYWGGVFLRHLFDRGYTEHEVISAYNQGKPRRTLGGQYRNQAYVDKVVAEIEDAKDVYHTV